MMFRHIDFKKIFSAVAAIIIFTASMTTVFAAGYVGNSNSKKFHHPTCSAAAKIRPANKVALNSREDAVRRGYVPCKICKP